MCLYKIQKLPSWSYKQKTYNKYVNQAGLPTPKAEAITEAYLNFRRKKPIYIEKDPILRFLSIETHVSIPAPAQEIIDTFANAENEEVLIAKGETLKEQLEYAKRILNERKKKSLDSNSDKEKEN